MALSKSIVRERVARWVSMIFKNLSLNVDGSRDPAYGNVRRREMTG